MTRSSARLSFVLLCAASLMAEWHALVATFSLALDREEYTHILLVLPIVTALLVLDRQAFKSSATPGFPWGPAICLVAAMIAALAKWESGFQSDTRVALAMLAVVVWVAGAFVLCFGTRAARTFLFPLGFLLWMVPIPSFMLARIITFLQQWSAFSAQVLFSAVRVPVSQDGFFLTIPGVTLEVAKECSSIRSSLMLVFISMVLAQVQLRSPWRKALVVAVAVPLAVAKNGLRIFTIGILGTKVDPGFLTGRLHHHGGVVFLIIALLVVFLLLWVLRRGEPMSVTPGFAPIAPLGSVQH